MANQAVGQRVLEAEYTNHKLHTAHMTGQIRCEDVAAGEIMAELFDANGDLRFDLCAGAHQHADSRVACNTLTMPVPPHWSVKCYRIGPEAGIKTKWAEID